MSTRLILLTSLFLAVFWLTAGTATATQEVETLKAGVVRIYNPEIKAQGSGFIINISEDQTQAYIVTAAHVVSGTATPDVYLPNGRAAIKGRVIDQESDAVRGLALLSVSGRAEDFSTLPTLELGQSLQMKGGEGVWIIGYPGGTSIPTVTAGNVARLEGRSVVISGSVNPGNSGGPAILDGKVMGIITDAGTFAYAVPAESIVLYLKGVGSDIIRTTRPQTRRRLPDRLLILVADFRAPTQKNYGVTETLINQLRGATRDYSDTEIKPLGEYISPEQGSKAARAKGKEYNAVIVLWGGYITAEEEVLLNVNFELLQRPERIELDSESELLRAPLAELRKNFNVQIKLSSKLAYLTLLTIGLARLEADDYDGAIARLTAALAQLDVPERMADRADVFLNLGRAYYLKSLFAVRDERTQADAAARGVAELNRYVSLRPTDADGYLVRAAAHMQAGEMTAAAADARKAIALDPKSSKAYVLHGIVELSGCNFERAACDLERATVDLNKAVQLLEPDADQSYVYFVRGTLHLLKEDAKGAVVDFSKVLELEPDGPFLPYILLMRGSAHAAAGDYEAAIKDFDRAIGLVPNNALFYYARGHARADNEERAAALSDYTKVINLMNETGAKTIRFGGSPIELADIYQARSEAYTSTGDYVKAFADVTEWLKLQPSATDAYYARANISILQGNATLAIKDYSEIIRLKPDDASAYLKRGEAYVTIRDLINAISDLRKAAQLATDSEIRQQAERRLRLLGLKN